MMFIINLKERYKEIKEEAIYEDYKKEVKRDFKRCNLTQEHDQVMSTCSYYSREYENLIRDCIPDKIMIYFAMEMFCIEHDVVLDKIHDVIIVMIKAKQIYMNKEYFHKNDYDLLCEDEKIIKNRFNF